MNNPVDYRAHNKLQHRDNFECLKEYGYEEFKDNASFIDIGCGDGSTTIEIVKQFLPNNFKELVGFDISQEMIQFADKHYASERISFKVVDIVYKIPDVFLGRFDRAFSFFTLHWVNNQELAYLNIYRLLNNGGSCFTTLLGNIPLFFDVYRILSESSKWNGWLLDVEKFVSPYHDYPKPELILEQIMKKIGYVNVKVICEEKNFVYDGVEDFKKAIRAVNPFKIPEEYFKDYMKDFIQIAREKGFLNNDYSMKYKLIIAFGKKE